MRKLEDAGYVAIDKSFVNRKPQTRIALTPEGRMAWLQWLERMRSIGEAAGG